jgi:hypothetical protein
MQRSKNQSLLLRKTEMLKKCKILLQENEALTKTNVVDLAQCLDYTTFVTEFKQWLKGTEEESMEKAKALAEHAGSLKKQLLNMEDLVQMQENSVAQEIEAAQQVEAAQQIEAAHKALGAAFHY